MTKSHFLLASSLGIVVVALVFRNSLTQFTSLGLFGIFLVNLIGSATLFLPAPAIASVVAGGVLYPAALVAGVSALGASIGDMIGYFLGKSGKSVLIKKDAHFLFTVVQDMFHKYGGIIIFLFALVPNPFFDAVGILAGMFFYPPKRFFVVMFVARFLRNLILASVGAAFK